MLTDRQLVGQHALLAQQADLVERGTYPLVALLERSGCNNERQRHVVVHGTIGEQLVILKHDADTAAERGDVPRSERARVLPVHQHRAARWALEKCDVLEHSALARAGTAREEDHLAGVNVESYIGERLSPVGIALAHPVERDHLAITCPARRKATRRRPRTRVGPARAP